jgi:hypothetical protein
MSHGLLCFQLVDAPHGFSHCIVVDSRLGPYLCACHAQEPKGRGFRACLWHQLSRFHDRSMLVEGHAGSYSGTPEHMSLQNTRIHPCDRAALNAKGSSL